MGTQSGTTRLVAEPVKTSSRLHHKILRSSEHKDDPPDAAAAGAAGEADRRKPAFLDRCSREANRDKADIWLALITFATRDRIGITPQQSAVSVIIIIRISFGFRTSLLWPVMKNPVSDVCNRTRAGSNQLSIIRLRLGNKTLRLLSGEMTVIPIHRRITALPFWRLLVKPRNLDTRHDWDNFNKIGEAHERST